MAAGDKVLLKTGSPEEFILLDTGDADVLLLEAEAAGVIGVGAQTLPSFTQAVAGTFAPGVSTGTSAQSLPSLDQAAAGTHLKTYTGTSAQDLPSLDQAAAGTFAAGASTGTAAQQLPSIDQAVAGTFAPGVSTGTAVQTLPSITQAAVGTPARTGTATQTAPNVTQIAAGLFWRSTPPGAVATFETKAGDTNATGAQATFATIAETDKAA